MTIQEDYDLIKQENNRLWEENKTLSVDNAKFHVYVEKLLEAIKEARKKLNEIGAGDDIGTREYMIIDDADDILFGVLK